MRVVGIDPGLSITGYGCVELSPGSPDPKLVEAGVFRLSRNASMASRLGQLFEDLCGLLDELGPDHLAVESLFSHPRYARTSIQMGHARGVVLLAGETRHLELIELGATEVKKAVTGHGHASKEQVQHAVMSQCGLRDFPEPHDLADAIAIALCATRRLPEPSIPD